jgi:hypothetical protein
MIETVTLSDSVGFHRDSSFLLHYISPNIVYGADNVLVDAQLSIHYLKKLCVYSELPTFQYFQD